jgi:Na+/proline symporter
LGLYWKRVNLTGVFTGMFFGVLMVAFLVLTKRDPFLGINAGFFSLCVNFVITVLVSLVTPAQRSGFDDSSQVSVKNEAIYK